LWQACVEGKAILDKPESGGGGEDEPLVQSTRLTGAVFIEGVAKAGETLTANTSRLDGSGEIFYTWKRGETLFASGLAIDGAAQTAYTLTEADNGAYIQVVVSRAGWDGSIASDPLGAVGSPPLTGTVSLRGEVEAGHALTADTSNLDGEGEITYVWKRGTTAGTIFTLIEGADGETYTLGDGDKSKYLAASVSRAGYSGWITSAASGKVPGEASAGPGSPQDPGGGHNGPGDSPEESLTLEGAAYIDGQPVVGRTLHVNTDSLSGAGALAFVWTRAEDEDEVGEPIAGATGVDYVVTTADGDKYLAAVVTRAGKNGSMETPALWVRKPGMTQEARIDGEALIYKTLTVNTDGITGGGNFSYVWKRGDKPDAINTAIAGADGAAYRLTPADWGKYIAVTVSAPEFDDTITTPPAGKVADMMDRWTALGNSGFGNFIIYDVIYGVGTAGGRFLACGEGGKMAWSVDGVTWTPVANSAFGSNLIYRVCLGKTPEGKPLFVAGGEAGKMAVSEDGETWKAVNSKLPNGKYDNVDGIAFGEVNGTEMFIAGSSYSSLIGGGNGGMTSSTDGVTWSSINGGGNFISSLCYAKPAGTGTFLTSGAENSDWSPAIWRFATGSFGWSRTYSGPKYVSGVKSIGWGEINGEGLFVAGGFESNKNPLVLYSKDGIKWTRATSMAYSGDTGITFVAYGMVAGGGRFVNIDSVSGRMAYSLDAANWRQVAATGIPSGDSAIKAVAYGSPVVGTDVFVAVGKAGKMSYTKFTAD
jgi:hypothetical protein